MRLVFLDRDGVINRFPGKGLYVTNEKEFYLLPRALGGIRLLTRKGFRLVVVSNQGCVSRGLITKAGLMRLTHLMLKKIKAAGGKIHKVYYCIHQKSDHCRCKKPKTLLFKKAMKGLRLDPRDIYFIGDSEEDIAAGHAIGCRTILVLSGRSKKSSARMFTHKPYMIKKDLLEAARWILQKKF
jgi:D-glycero-D-manno-heptose 1,7-bisphosphate phosphatase